MGVGTKIVPPQKYKQCYCKNLEISIQELYIDYQNKSKICIINILNNEKVKIYANDRKKTFSKFIQTARRTMVSCLNCFRETEQ